ncbi:MAG: hypothetical protein ROZ09_11565 [Thiobacillus sp.]|uniref:hypothetical protein n=1 Tax=Thiobacillus sp. TaxID=924 RepID=UPI00289489D6|nr:hypothetical protein [Thiobacillus sp.]MDT3707457.1 hypothetical protein [Thiobacillus sp.]
MNPPEPISYLVDNNANLHIKDGKKHVVLPPAGALDLLKFLERTQFLQNATNQAKGGQA